MTAPSFLRRVAPPALVKWAGRLSGRSHRFDPVPQSWAAATARATGYDTEVILQRVTHATREVVAGRAAFERDSVLFAEPEMPVQLLAPLMRCALRDHGRLEVIDFGGSLGSTYRQCRPYLDLVEHLKWHVVEQAAFVSAGLAEFASDELDFHATLDEIATQVRPMALASGVLQYLEAPHEIIHELSQTDAQVLMIDRTPVSDEKDDVISLQRVPAHIYPASYPCWIFSRAKLIHSVGPGWRLLADLASLDGASQLTGGFPFQFRGFLFERAPW